MKILMTLVLSFFAFTAVASVKRYEAYKCKIQKGSVIEEGASFIMYQEVEPSFFGKSLANDMYFKLPNNHILGEIRAGGYFYYNDINMIPASFTNGLNVSIQFKPNKSIGKIKRRFKAELVFTDNETNNVSLVNIKCRRR